MFYKSKYNYIYKRNNNTWVICNTLSGSIVVLSESEKRQYDLLTDNNIAEDVFTKQLKRQGILCDLSFSEKDYLEKSREKVFTSKNDIYYRILTTTDCNAKCPYCFEKGIDKCSMSRETSNRIVKYINDTLDRKNVNIHWFGGEPLLNKDAIYSIMSGLLPVFARRGVGFKTYFTTNGTLLDDKIIKEMKASWNTDNVQISIEEIGEKYDSIRQYHGAKYSFDVVINNIRKLVENNINVSLCVKYFPSKIEKISEILDCLSERLNQELKGKYLRIYPGPIFEAYSTDRVVSIKPPNNIRYYEACMELEKKNLANGRNLFPIKFKPGQCYACTEGSLTFAPDGGLYKCALCMTDKSTKIGDVFSGVNNSLEVYKKWVSTEIPKECETCIYLPLCQGGCKAGYFGYTDFQCYKNMNEFEKIVEYNIKYLETKGGD